MFFQVNKKSLCNNFVARFLVWRMTRCVQFIGEFLNVYHIHMIFHNKNNNKSYQLKLRPPNLMEGGSFLNARKLLFYNAVFRSFFNAPGVISQRARAVTSHLNFVCAAAPFILQRTMVLIFCSPRFSVSWFLGLLVSGFLGFLVSGSLGFSVSWFLGFCFFFGFWSLGFSVSRFVGFCVSWFLGFLVSGSLGF